VNDALAQKNARRVGILGTQFVMRSSMFGRLRNVEVVPLSSDQIALVHANYAKVALNGTLEGFDFDGVRAVGQDLAARGADTVLLAGTELSLAFEETNAGFRVLDCARVHIDAILARAYGA
jgi:aspartate racemase